jgi:hypothetical protein
MTKTVATFLAVVAMVVTLHAFRVMNQSTITGRIIPSHRAGLVWAICDGDTLKAKHSDGVFNFTVKPGSWKLIVKGNASFDDAVFFANAKKGKTVDLGEIIVQ